VSPPILNIASYRFSPFDECAGLDTLLAA